MTRRKVFALALVLVLLATVAVVLIAQRSARSPAQDATASCRDAERFQQLVKDNASVDDVLDLLGKAEQKAASAAERDPTWLALSGGLQSIRIALKADDAEAARVGISVVRAECRRVP